ncbi:hypothetical protein Scep_027308 [Stephania cephalantha]|uniref:Pentatricopeptide repeat-containing protein n=1 Tax=Stephania cephalantha TaxID=152367 RepID=A0AAP0E7X6_9MAGN
MEIKGSHKPGPVIYSTVIDGLCKNNELDKAFKLVKDMIHNNALPDVVICNSLIHGLCNAGMLEEAVSFFAEIKNLGISPNVVTFGTVVDALSKEGRMAEALGLFELMSQSEGLQPDTRTYNSSIYGYCHLRAWKEALKLFDEMWGRKMSPNSATFSIIFIALCKEGMVNKAHYLLEVMIQNGVEPDVSMYNRLMDGYCLQGKMEEAVKAFDSVQEDWMTPIGKGVIPDAVTYSTLIQGLCKVGRVTDAEVPFNKMQIYGQIPDLFAYGALIGGLCYNKHFNEAMTLFHELETNGLMVDLHGRLQNHPMLAREYGRVRGLELANLL